MLKMLVETPAMKLAKDTGFKVEHCDAFLHPENKNRLARAVEECLLTQKQKVELAEIDITVVQVLEEMYTFPEFPVIQPIFKEWNSQLKLEVFRTYTPKYRQK